MQDKDRKEKKMNAPKPVEVKALSPDDLSKTKNGDVELKEEELQSAAGGVAIKTISWSYDDEG